MQKGITTRRHLLLPSGGYVRLRPKPFLHNKRRASGDRYIDKSLANFRPRIARNLSTSIWI